MTFTPTFPVDLNNARFLTDYNESAAVSAIAALLPTADVPQGNALIVTHASARMIAGIPGGQTRTAQWHIWRQSLIRVAISPITTLTAGQGDSTRQWYLPGPLVLFPGDRFGITITDLIAGEQINIAARGYLIELLGLDAGSGLRTPRPGDLTTVGRG